MIALLVSVLSAMAHAMILSDGSSELELSIIAENGLLPGPSDKGAWALDHRTGPAFIARFKTK
jgi:hypothetical protein